MSLKFSNALPSDGDEIIQGLLNQDVHESLTDFGLLNDSVYTIQTTEAIEVWSLNSDTLDDLRLQEAKRIGWKHLTLSNRAGIDELNLSYRDGQLLANYSASIRSRSLFEKLVYISKQKFVEKNDYEVRILNIEQISLDFIWLLRDNWPSQFILATIPDNDSFRLNHEFMAETELLNMLEPIFGDLKSKIESLDSKAGGRPIGSYSVVEQDLTEIAQVDFAAKTFALPMQSPMLLNRTTQLNFSMQHQEEDYWCWAAVGASVSEFINQLTTAQCEVAALCLNPKTCCTNRKYCDEPWYLEYALSAKDNYSYDQAGVISLSQIQNEIDNGMPVCVRIDYSGNVGHFICIAGYESDLLTIYDPLQVRRRMTYKELLYGYDSGHWNWTYFCH